MQVLTLSIVIVNYNVKYFLEQCLCSLRKSCLGINAEVIVVDNQSSDGSIDYLSPRFPEVRFLLSERNEGFSKACNRGASLAKGKYILFLNPDTIVAEDSLSTCIQFLETHVETGAVGVKMIDGSGRFLKESKRAFPVPLTSLYKLFGFSRLFPKSKIFSRYYLGHLDQNKNHEVEVLAGAFMMIRREALEKTGLFDEAFFMYGEDIDLSYRIKIAGFNNYYIADTSIIHFKGESTKRGTLNYVRMFYNAMSIFVKKHYGGSKAWFFTTSLHIAIWFRALVSVGVKLVRWVGIPFIDALSILFSFWIVKEAWERFIKPETLYPENLLLVALPLFTIVFLVAAYYAGLYNKRFRKVDLTRSMFVATAVLLAVYALFPEEYRFSRGVVLFGSLLSFLLIGLLRSAMIRGGLLQKPFEHILHPYMVIAATADEYQAVKHFLQKKKVTDKVIGRIAIDEKIESSVASLKELKDVSLVLGAEELVFVAGEGLCYKDIIDFISVTKLSLRLRFHASGSCSIIGSDSNTASGEVIASEMASNLAKPNRRRVKRLIDVTASLLFIITFPLHFLLVKKPLSFFANCFQVLIAQKTWVGYTNTNASLPTLRKPVIRAGKESKVVNVHESSNEIDYWYAKNYEPVHDIRLIVKNYIHLGG